MMGATDFRKCDDFADRMNRPRIRRMLVQRHMKAGYVIQEGHQKPIASNPKKLGICGIRGMDGQSVSTKNWRRTARVFDDVGTRTTSTQDRGSYRHGCSMKKAAGVLISDVRKESKGGRRSVIRSGHNTPHGKRFSIFDSPRLTKSPTTSRARNCSMRWRIDSNTWVGGKLRSWMKTWDGPLPAQ